MTFEELSTLVQSAITLSLQDRDNIRNMMMLGLGNASGKRALEAVAIEDRERLRNLQALALEDGEHIRALVRIAEIRERRLSRLEGEE